MHLNEHMEYIEELVRKVYSMLSGDSSKELDKMLNKDFRDRFIQRNPKCFLPLLTLKTNDPIPFFPICNTGGMVDQRLIDFSKKLCKRLSNEEFINHDHLKIIEIRLDSLSKKFSKDIPKPQRSAIIKGQSTKKFKKKQKK